MFRQINKPQMARATSQGNGDKHQVIKYATPTALMFLTYITVPSFSYKTLIVKYCIVQNSGGIKLWQIGAENILMRKTGEFALAAQIY